MRGSSVAVSVEAMGKLACRVWSAERGTSCTPLLQEWPRGCALELGVVNRRAVGARG
jgi:hypothetical protein